MKPKATFATAAAIALLSGAGAMAGDNVSHLFQNGDSNAALIDQSAGSRNHAGALGLAVRQDGSDNALEFRQSGNGNEIGTQGEGFLQRSNRSTATITQSSNRNRVDEVLQTGLASSLGSQARNTLTIEQKRGNGNVVERVEQERTRPAFDIFGLTDLQAANQAAIVQDGTGNRVGLLSQTGRDNRASLSFAGSYNDARSLQRGAGNRATAVVNGDLNTIRIEQESGLLGNTARIDVEGTGNRLSASQTGAANTLDVAIAGHGNNALPFFSGGVGTLALGADLAPGDIVQNGSFNSIDYTLGSESALSLGNRFAFRQDGFANSIEGHTDGIGNQVVVVQNGTLNLTSFVQVGNFNVIGVNQ